MTTPLCIHCRALKGYCPDCAAGTCTLPRGCSVCDSVYDSGLELDSEGRAIVADMLANKERD